MNVGAKGALIFAQDDSQFWFEIRINCAMRLHYGLGTRSSFLERRERSITCRSFDPYAVSSLLSSLSGERRRGESLWRDL